MKPISLLVAAACIVLLSVTQSAAEDVTLPPATADYVMPGCRAFVAITSGAQLPASGAQVFLQGVCMGAVAALAELGVTDVCIPKGVTRGQSVRVVAAYIDARPARLHEDFNARAMEAIRAAWPCR